MTSVSVSPRGDTETEGVSLSDAAEAVFSCSNAVSMRSRTPAFTVDGIALNSGTAALHRHLDRQVGRSTRAVVETDGFARAEDFAPVIIESGVPGSVLVLTLVARDGDRLIGRPIS